MVETVNQNSLGDAQLLIRRLTFIRNLVKKNGLVDLEGSREEHLKFGAAKPSSRESRIVRNITKFIVPMSLDELLIAESDATNNELKDKDIRRSNEDKWLKQANENLRRSPRVLCGLFKLRMIEVLHMFERATLGDLTAKALQDRVFGKNSKIRLGLRPYVAAEGGSKFSLSADQINQLNEFISKLDSFNPETPKEETSSCVAGIFESIIGDLASLFQTQFSTDEIENLSFVVDLISKNYKTQFTLDEIFALGQWIVLGNDSSRLPRFVSTLLYAALMEQSSDSDSKVNISPRDAGRTAVVEAAERIEEATKALKKLKTLREEYGDSAFKFRKKNELDPLRSALQGLVEHLEPTARHRKAITTSNKMSVRELEASVLGFLTVDEEASVSFEEAAKKKRGLSGVKPDCAVIAD